jgi:hypothetical protein
MPHHVWKPQLISVLAVSEGIKLVVVEGAAPHQKAFKVGTAEVIPLRKYMRKWVVEVEGGEVVVSASNRC